MSPGEQGKRSDQREESSARSLVVLERLILEARTVPHGRDFLTSLVTSSRILNTRLSSDSRMSRAKASSSRRGD